ncbi:MAG: helix-turn-helix transcriptional regulator [Clostridium sp.]|uniref:helix-turn-helix domain-containing protein n=1 Tax=Clostridium sp. TaxID=1506 RepID=UPI00305AC848
MKSKIKAKRVERGIMQRRISAELNVNIRTYQRIENEGRKITDEELEIISRVLDCRKSELVEEG